MRKIIFTVSAILLTAGVLCAQENESLNRRIEVTRQYVPEVEGARKLEYSPRMTDTVTLKPYIDYAITPTPWKSVFGTEPIAPIDISTARYEPMQPFYLRIGAGYPLASLANIRASFGNRASRHFGIYADHSGQWQQLIDNLNNYYGRNENRLGFKGGFAAGKRNFDYDLHYNLNARQWNGMNVHSAFNYFNNLDMNIRFGDSFADLSRFNYRVGIDGGLWGNSLQSLTHNGGAGAFADFSWPAGNNAAVMLGAGFDGYWATGISDQLISLTPHYRIYASDLTLKVGAKLYFNAFNRNANRGNDIYAIPDIKISYRFLPALEPYLNIDGNVGSGSYNALYELNPYVTPLSAGMRPKSVALQGGIRGNARDILVYDINAGYLAAETFCFVRSFDTGAFTPIAVPLNTTHVAANLGLKFPFGFGILAGARYNVYNNDGNFWRAANGNLSRFGMGIPALNLSAALSYDCRNKLFTKIGVDFVGKRYFASVQDYYTEVPAYVNLYASAEYKFNSKFSLFLRGDNLLNAPMYYYLDYPEFGISVMAGFTVIF